MRDVRLDECIGSFVIASKFHYHLLCELFFQFYLASRLAPSCPILHLGAVRGCAAALIERFRRNGHTVCVVSPRWTTVSVGNYYTVDAAGRGLAQLDAAFPGGFRDYARFLVEGFPAQRSTGEADGALIFARRSGAARRAVRNAGAIEAAALAAGFRVVDFGELPFPEQVALAARARVVAGFHDSNLANAMAADRMAADLFTCSRGSTLSPARWRQRSPRARLRLPKRFDPFAFYRWDAYIPGLPNCSSFADAYQRRVGDMHRSTYGQVAHGAHLLWDTLHPAARPLTLYLTGHGGRVAGHHFLGKAAGRAAIGLVKGLAVFEGGLRLGAVLAAASDMNLCN